MAECACCGQTLPYNYPNGLRLTPQLRRCYDIIRRAGQSGIHSDIIFDRMYKDDEDGGPLTATKIISVYVCSLNKKLPPFGQKILSDDWGGRRDNHARYRLVLNA